jgi:hypothetical protein
LVIDQEQYNLGEPLMVTEVCSIGSVGKYLFIYDMAGVYYGTSHRYMPEGIIIAQGENDEDGNCREQQQDRYVNDKSAPIDFLHFAGTAALLFSVTRHLQAICR